MESLDKIRVSVIEQSPLYLAGYLQLLSDCDEIEVLDFSHSSRELFDRIDKNPPDVVLTGLESSDWDIAEMLKYVEFRQPLVKVVVNGPIDPGPLVKLLLKQGASAYFVRNEINKCELIRILIDSHHFGIAQSRLVTASVIQAVKQSNTLFSNTDLSDRETEILALACKGYDRKLIAKSISVAESTVKFHLDRMRDKFKCKSVLQLVVHAIKEGLVPV